jgi:hypothetical protein
MSEPHTADLGTRYRYREEGRKFEIERREAWLNRVRTWYPEKANIWMEGYETAETRIIKLLEADRNESHAIDDIFDGIVFQTLSRAEFKQALIELIKGENK